MTLLEAIATQGFAGLLANLASSYLLNKTNKLSSNNDEIGSVLSPNLNAAFKKCTEIKTILSDNVENFLEIYSDQLFTCDDKTVDQYHVVDIVRSGKSIIVTGTGGGGKSMFMRYLWLSYFEDPRRKVPFLLELRQLNRLTHNSFEDFLYHSIVPPGSNVTQQSFNRALKAGHFILFLDGFDEINFDRRQHFEETLIDLKDRYPGLTMVVSSRPDDRFRGWHQFQVVKVAPLDKVHAIRLIKRAPFDRSAVNKIIKKMDEGLYESHQSFLSTPLLAYMLLVTFSYNPDIPKRMFLFYEQAFEALYHRHNLTKGGYKRKFRLEMDKQSFIRQLPYFSLMSYYDEMFEFRDENLRNYIEKSKNVEKSNYDTELFIADMMESLCLLKKEGFEYSFTHRSFQEYFAAYCIARVASRNIDVLFAKFAERYNDQVLGMVYDINKDLFREKYIMPMREKYKKFYDLSDEEEIVKEFFCAVSSRFRIKSISHLAAGSKRRRRHEFFIDYRPEGEFYRFHANVERLARDYGVRFTERGDAMTTRDADDLFSKKLYEHFGNSEDYFEVLSDGIRYILLRNGTEVPDGARDFKWQETFMFSFIRQHALKNRTFIASEVEQYNGVTQSFQEFFA